MGKLKNTLINLLVDAGRTASLAEGIVEKANLTVTKLHIPLIISTDVPKAFARTLANTQQIKIASQLLKVLENSGSKIFSGNGQGLVKSLKESVESLGIKDYELLGEEVSDKILKTAQVVGAVAAAAYGVKKLMQPVDGTKGKPAEKDGQPFGIKSKESIGQEGMLLSSEYTEIEITSKGMMSSIFGAKKLTILIKVYVLALDTESFVSGLGKLSSKITSAVKGIKGDSKNIGSPMFRGSFAQVITDQMIEDKAWGSLLQNRKIGCSIAVSRYAVEEMKLKGLDITKEGDLKKLISLLKVFDLFIVSEETEEIEYLDPTTFRFETIPFGMLKSGNTNRRKVSLMID